MLRARPGARLTALTSGGAIPDTADYEVMLEPQAQLIGSDARGFRRGKHGRRRLPAGQCFLPHPARGARPPARGGCPGAPPSIPFWIGEAPGRSDELSRAVSRLRQAVSDGLDEGLEEAVCAWWRQPASMANPRARSSTTSARARPRWASCPPSVAIAMERFFDEAGGTQLVIHSPYGVRLNRAWGLALRKRFCRSFNFELQAAATEEAIVLSLSTSHSFPLADVAKFLHANTVRDVLVQALLDAPMFPTRWRWNATTALALPRYVGGRKVAAARSSA